jgi:endonuclease YncB( thermonuclease family)
MPALQFALLAVSLLLFLFSTRQFKLPVRMIVWFAGIVVLSWAAWFSLSKPGHAGLFAIIGDFFSHLGNTQDSLLVRSVSGNWGAIGIAIGPTFDAFLVLALLVAGTALIAFTPGEGVERVERPVNIALIGAILGGLLALVIASVGFGGVAKRKVYINTVSAADVIDGDTLRMGDVSLRLWGIDAPESDQLCRSASGEAVPCGPEAGKHLSEMIAGKLIWCGPPSQEGGQGPDDLPALKETFGRPIATCRIRDGEKETDIAQAMVRDGYARIFEDEDGPKTSYLSEQAQAIRAGAGLHADEQSFLSPWLWRNDPAARCQFLGGIGWDKLNDRLESSCRGFQAANDNAKAEPAPAVQPN